MAWLGNWKKRIKITVDSGDIDAALSDFPVPIYLSTSSGTNSADVSAVFDELELDANRKKIAVTTSDGITECYVEIEQWDDANEKAWLWVKIPSIASGVDTDLYLYYDAGKSDNDTYVGDTNSTPAENVWDANFKAVYHMRDGASNAAIYDSTANNNDGTKRGANEPIEIAGQIAGAQDFDGGDDYIDCGAPANLNFGTGDFSLETLFRCGDNATTKVLLQKSPSHGGPGLGYWFYIEAAGDARFYIKDSDGDVKFKQDVHNFEDDIWTYLVAQRDSDFLHLFRDGADIGGAVDASIVDNIDTASHLVIGANSPKTARFFLGDIDEVRVSDIARTAAWIKATKESLWDDLLTFGVEEQPNTIYIDGIEIVTKKGSIVVENRIEERSIANFTTIDLDGTASYTKGQPVLIYDPNGLLIFGGVIDNPETVRTAPSGELLHPISCVDYHYFADKRLVAASYEDKTCGFIVEDIFDNYLAEEGVTIGNIDLGATLVQAVFNYVRVTDAYDALAEKAGFIWFIDENKKLYFQARDTTAAPWTLTGDDVEKGSGILSGANPMYRNRQYIRGGKGTTVLQTETFTGDGVRLAFTVGYPIVKVPTVTVADRVPEGQGVGIKGIDVAEDCYWSKGDPVIVFEVAPENGKLVTIEYYGEYNLLGLAVDAPAIAALQAIEGTGTGYVDDIADEPKLTDSDAVLDSGQAKLAKYAVDARLFRFSTTRTGLKPSQLLTVLYPALGLDGDMLIESVTTRVYTGNLHYDVVAIVGAEQRGWTEYFKSLSKMKQEVIDFLNVGSEEILIILAEDDGVVEVEGDISGTVIYACSLVGTGEVDSATVC